MPRLVPEQGIRRGTYGIAIPRLIGKNLKGDTLYYQATPHRILLYKRQKNDLSRIEIQVVQSKNGESWKAIIPATIAKRHGLRSGMELEVRGRPSFVSIRPKGDA